MPPIVGEFLLLVTSCVGLWKEEPQTARPMSFTWVSHIAANVLTRCKTLPNQSLFCEEVFHNTVYSL